MDVCASSVTIEEQRDLIKIYTLCKISKTNIYKNWQEACGTSSLSWTIVFEWAHRFKEGRASIIDNARSGRPSCATDEIHVNSVSVVINEDPRKTCNQKAYTLEISHASVQKILTEKLGKRKVAAKFVHHDLSIEHKLNRVHVLTSILLRFFHEGFDFLHRIVVLMRLGFPVFNPKYKDNPLSGDRLMKGDLLSFYKVRALKNK